MIAGIVCTILEYKIFPVTFHFLSLFLWSVSKVLSAVFSLVYGLLRSVETLFFLKYTHSL